MALRAVFLDAGNTLVGLDYFHHAAAALGVAPAEAVHVGDLYSVDVVGARAAGACAILLDPVGAWLVDDCPKVPDVAAAAQMIARMT